MPLIVPRTGPRWPRLLAGLALGTSGVFAARFFFQRAEADSGKPTKVFGSGPAFIWLPLESSEYVSGDTKRLRFTLPQRDSVSGLTLTCKPQHL